MYYYNHIGMEKSSPKSLPCESDKFPDSSRILNIKLGTQFAQPIMHRNQKPKKKT